MSRRVCRRLFATESWLGEIYQIGESCVRLKTTYIENSFAWGKQTTTKLDKMHRNWMLVQTCLSYTSQLVTWLIVLSHQFKFGQYGFIRSLRRLLFLQALEFHTQLKVKRTEHQVAASLIHEKNHSLHAHAYKMWINKSSACFVYCTELHLISYDFLVEKQTHKYHSWHVF